MSAYSADVLATSGLLYYWQFAEPSGTTATDSQGTNTGTYQGTVTLGQTGIPGDDTAVLLDGSTGFVTTTTNPTSPSGPFSIEVWFKTTTVTGGGLIGFGNTQTSTAAQAGGAERTIYLTDDGKVNFTIWTGSAFVTLTSAAAYNDGNFHHTVGVIAASNNMALYVDTVAASNANVTAPQNYSGFWRLGHQTLAGNGFPGTHTSDFLSATIGHGAVYSTDLSAATVLDHYTVGTTAVQQFIHPFNAIPFMSGH